MNAKRLSTRLAALCVVGLLASACGEDEPPFPTFDELDKLRLMHTIPARPPPDATNRFADNAKAAELGERLFNDPSLSSCGEVSCASCHKKDEGSTVRQAKANGCNGGVTGRNPPSILNVDYLSWFMWDGRADRLWNQAILPMTSPIEMDSNPELIRSRLIATYKDDYTNLFGEPPETTEPKRLLANVGKLMQAYERKVGLSDAPFDEDVKRFIAAVEEGREEQDPSYFALKTYFRKGQCITCHQGVMMSDNLFHNIGVKDSSEGAPGQKATVQGVLDWEFNAAGPYSDSRNGQEAARLAGVRATLDEKLAEMEGAYKTPPLRNVALTAPYMHTGELNTLADVIEFYNKGGDEDGTFSGTRTETIKKLDLTEEEKAALVQLLESMTGTRSP